MLKLGNREVSDIYVFDEFGNKVATLDSLKNTKLINTDYPTKLYISDALLNPDMLNFLSKKEPSQHISDYEKLLKQGVKCRTFVFNKTKKKCKVIALTQYRDEGGFDRQVYYEFPRASVSTAIDYESNGFDHAPTDLVFEILPFNEDGDTYKLHIEERDYLFTKEEIQQEINKFKDQLFGCLSFKTGEVTDKTTTPTMKLAKLNKGKHVLSAQDVPEIQIENLKLNHNWIRYADN
ncbi:hypothetical protein [Paenibacillus sp. Marseille-Q4541]|uniref:hypothetical protein n=1 Tax=Paenibacillus sp. Marseille-Q4541 TaxID=2831522 RepID=UPI001BAC3BF0|nr:hypothetical protein [Paenibacillus sp. Marseille-Q4541]